MQRLIVLFLTTLCLFSLSLTLYPQTKQKESNAKSNQGLSSKVRSLYEQSKDLTTINTEPLLLSDKAADKLELEAYFMFRGKIPTEKPRGVLLFINSTSKKEQFENFNELTLTLDGENVPLGSMRRGHKSCEKSLPRGTGCLLWVEKMDLFIPYESFLRVIQANKVNGKVGTRTFVVNEATLEVLREFNKSIIPQRTQEF